MIRIRYKNILYSKNDFKNELNEFKFIDILLPYPKGIVMRVAMYISNKSFKK